MVKRPRIAQKPATTPKAADAWVSSGGMDPELQTPAEALLSKSEENPASTPTEPQEDKQLKGKPFPHRISFDTTNEQYKRLKKAGFEQEQSLNEIIREAVENWLTTRNY